MCHFQICAWMRVLIGTPSMGPITGTCISINHGHMHQDKIKASEQVVLVWMWARALCIRYTIIPPLLTDLQQFHYCTDSNPGTGADDAFVSKRGVWRNATWPLHSRPAIAASARHFQICFLPEYFDRLFVYLLFVYLVLFMHQAMSNIFWHLRMFI